MGEPSMSRQMELSMMFPGFKFSPTDEELISYYLKKKIEGSDSVVEVIPELDLCQFEPWDLPDKSVIQSDSEWFFFSARGRKYPNGLQSKRATESGYWKATGKERNVKSGPNVIGTKRTLVFHRGRAPKGERTEWIMHEYCMSGNSQDSRVVCRLRKNIEFRLNDNPRRAAQNRPGDDGNIRSGEDDIEQTGIFDGDKALDGCHNSYNSQSLEPTDSGSESNQNLTDQPPHNAVSSQQKDCDSEEDCFAEIMNDDIINLDECEEDCFAEIMNDDIINLDECSLSTIPRLQQAEINSEQAIQRDASNVAPAQGTANRRIRLRRNKSKFNHSLSEDSEVEDEACPSSAHVQTPSRRVVKWQFIVTILLILTLLALFLLCLDWY